ncbi:4'-phosphopantetheinyl transferase superfamily protein [Aquimarina aquimarini]|uniref:4'-phosphopantetheinyl transferase family protein n=1 Tax=Aquimarina aquimarini TaxID=1191734 RepID=UPI000D54E91E|nr:4'-phosphopantetheinyl transferase superfamily protein [Aquimarina aquimarini]
MIGNDIVDFQVATQQSNWQRRGWLQKIYTGVEQHYILTSENPETLIWKFWSMKEATYKAHQRRFGFSPRYNPKSFECTLKNKVNVDSEQYDLNVQVFKYYVHSIAFTSKVSYTTAVYKNEREIYTKIKEKIAEEFDISTVSIVKDKNRIPVICINKENTTIPVSLTHHGDYTAFVFQKSK